MHQTYLLYVFLDFILKKILLLLLQNINAFGIFALICVQI